MATSDIINSMKEHVQDAYSQVETMKGTVPAQKNLVNLAEAIATVKTGTDTSDGTATASDIKSGKVAYSKGVKLTGTFGAETKTVTPTEQQQTVSPSSGKYLSSVVVNKIPDGYVIPSGSIEISENGTHDVAGLASVVVNVPSEKPQLIAPEIARQNSYLNITDKNGSWANQWKITCGGTTSVVGVESVNLAQIFASLAAGSYSITAKSSNSENKMNDSVDSNKVAWSIYGITYTLTNCSATTKPTKAYQGAGVSIVLKANTNYALPSSVTVTGATIASYNSSTGALVLSNPTGAVKVTCVATQTVFTITTALEHCKADSSNPTTIDRGGSATLIFTADNEYQLPATVNVVGNVTFSWEQSTGMLDLSNPTGNVYITIRATEKPQLATPQNVSIDGTTLSWDEVENATSYDIYADGTLIGNTTGVTGETWLLNETISLANFPTTGATDYKMCWFFPVAGTCNNTSFTYLVYDEQGNFSSTGSWALGNATQISNSYTEMYANGAGWSNEVYRTITLNEPASGDFLTWLQTNAVKQ